MEREGDEEIDAARAARELPLLQQHMVEEMIAAEGVVEEEDCPLLATSISMTQTEFDLLSELLRVFDQARSHFIFEVCEPSVKRFLNAMRIHHEEENDARMPWIEY